MVVAVQAEPSFRSQSAKLLGDYYYLKKDYQLAQIEYERALQFSSHKKSLQNDIHTKLSLSLLYQGKFLESKKLLKGRREFSHLYLSMFSALREGQISYALRQQGRILASPEISMKKKDEALLLGGSIYLEEGNYQETHAFYKKLQRKTQDRELRKKTGYLLSALQRYEEQPRKSSALAGVFSTLLPGSGQIYAEHYTDGLIAFCFNAVLIGSALVLYDLESSAGRAHYASIGVGLIGLQFYIANIGGAIQSAQRYNNFKERQFHQEIRDSFFNVDYVQKTSGAGFHAVTE